MAQEAVSHEQEVKVVPEEQIVQTLPGKPVALVGASYGSYDRISIVRNIFDKSDWDYEDAGVYLPASEFENYSVVILAHSLEHPYSAEEQKLIRKFVEEGGTLLLLNRVVAKLNEPRSEVVLEDWLGMTFGSGPELLPEMAQIMDDPVLEGVVEANGAVENRPSWISGKYGVRTISEGVDLLIGGDQMGIVVRKRAGKGVVYFLAHELFRLRAAASEHLEQSDSYVRLIHNILAEARPLKLSDWKAQQVQEWKEQGKKLLIWDREWQRGIATGPVFKPPLPQKEELLQSLQINSAVDEIEAVQVNLSAIAGLESLEWELQIDGVDPSAVKVFLMERPDPIPWPKAPELVYESPYWLMPMDFVSPKNPHKITFSKDETQRPGETKILWLKFDSHHIPFGNYHGKITFKNKEEVLAECDILWNVYPVKVPKRKLITLQPLGHVYGDVLKTEPALRFKRNLRDHGFEWTLINAFRLNTFSIKDRGAIDAKLLQEVLPEIQQGKAPMIDFSSMDEWMDASIAHNLTYFRVTQALTASIDGLSERAGFNEEETKSVRTWFLRETARYLQDRGVHHYYASYGDELSRDELEKTFLPWAEELVENGWTTTSSFTTASVADEVLTNRLTRVVGAWTLNRMFIMRFMEWKRAGVIQVPEGTLVGTYGAGEGRGTEIRKNMSASRMIGWEAWGVGSDYCAPNPYFKGWLYYLDYTLDRGFAGERFVSYLKIDDLDADMVNSPFIEGMRESLEEANLAAVLRWYVEKLGDKAPAEITRKMNSLVGDEETSILSWQEKTHADIEVKTLTGTREQFSEAKLTVLNLLYEIAPLVKEAGIKPSLEWNGHPLLKDGKWVVQIQGYGVDVEILKKALSDLVGVPYQEAENPETLVIAGMAGHPELPAEAANYAQAPKENYGWIRSWKNENAKKSVLWIGGNSEEAVKLRLTQFPAFLDPRGHWLLQ